MSALSSLLLSVAVQTAHADTTPATTAAEAAKVVGGCMASNIADAPPDTSVCTEFMQPPTNPLTAAQVAGACAENNQTFVTACATTGVSAICKVDSGGYPANIVLYSDNNPAIIQDFDDSCSQQGGTVAK